MVSKRTFFGRLVGWLFFYGGVLPYAVPRCLDWLSRPSNYWLACGALGLLALGAGVAYSLYRAGRALTRYLLHRSSTPPSPFND